jgi:hypothetical protein
MKKLSICILTITLSINIFAQCDLPNYVAPVDLNTGSNMTVLVQSSTFDNLPSFVDSSYIVALTSSGLIVGASYLSNPFLQEAITIWGDDSLTPEIDGAISGENISFQLINGSELYDLNVNPNILYATNTFNVLISVQLVQVNCELPGCIDSLALNYDPFATFDDGSCNYPIISGCTDINADNFDINAEEDDGSCQFSGCTDSTSFNYDSFANIDNGSCLNEVTVSFDSVTLSSVASQYLITSDNIDSIDLTLGNSQVMNGDLIGAFYFSSDSNLSCAGFSVWDNEGINISLVNDDPSTNEIDGVSNETEIFWIIQQSATLFNFLVNISSTSIGIGESIENIVLNENLILGCNLPTAYNFNPYANIYDNACVPFISGCTDNLFCNFDPEANTDDGSCYNVDVTLSIDFNQLVGQSSSEFVSYQWYIMGNDLVELPGANSNIYVPLINGDYHLIITDTSGCQASSNIEFSSISINEILSNNVNVFPNPLSNGNFIIESYHDKINKIEIFDLSGKLVLNNTIMTHRFEIPKKFQSGMYSLKIYTNNSIFFKKLLVL